MKKVYAEPMTKVMKLNVSSIMDPTIDNTSIGNNGGSGDGPVAADLF